MNTTKSLVVVVVLFAAAAFVGGYLWRGSKNDDDTTISPTPTPSVVVTATPSASTPAAARKAMSYTVRLTASGVQPAALSIRVGDSVTFRNDTDRSFWPASDPHPSHTDCPGFDARRSLAAGESYTLVFPTPKTCGYHNHEAPTDSTMRGTIVVQ